MKKYFKDMLQFLKKPSFTVPLLLTVIVCYGYYLAVPSVGIDDLARERYVSGLLFSQGRFSSTIISYALFFAKETPIIKDYIAVIFLSAAAAALAVVMKSSTQNKLKPALYTVFACLFVSYPLINEIYIYNGANLNISIGYFLTAVSVLLAETVIGTPDNRKKVVISTLFNCLIWIFLMSLYESFAFVYILLVCVVMVCKNYFAEKEMTFREMIINVAVYAFPLVLGICLEFIIGKVIISAFNISGTNYGANTAVAFSELFSVNGIISAVYSIFRKHFLAGLWYFPIGEFAFCLLVSVGAGIALCVKRKNAQYALYFLGMFFALFIMGILKAGDLKYRISQAHAIFVVFMLVFSVHIITTEIADARGEKAGRIAAVTATALCTVLIAAQSVCLCRYFINDCARWAEEKDVLVTIGSELSKLESAESKPVYFIGEYILSDEIMEDKFVSSNDPLYAAMNKIWSPDTTDFDETYVLMRAQGENGSVITWGLDAFDECNTELLNLFEYVGYEFKQGDYETFLELRETASDYPSFPEEGYIREEQDCIIVNFG